MLLGVQDPFNNTWLDPESLKTYRKKENCLVNQYNSYKVGWVDCNGTNKEVFVNGKHTVGENIADTGVAPAYKAYGMNLISEYE